MWRVSSDRLVRPRRKPRAAPPPLWHYHTGTSSNRRRLMYAWFVSVFEFRIQMAHLSESRWLTGPNSSWEEGYRARRMVREGAEPGKGNEPPVGLEQGRTRMTIAIARPHSVFRRLVLTVRCVNANTRRRSNCGTRGSDSNRTLCFSGSERVLSCRKYLPSPDSVYRYANNYIYNYIYSTSCTIIYQAMISESINYKL